MTKNLERIKIKAFLQTLKEQYPEQFAPAVQEFMDEKESENAASIDVLLEQIIDEDFAEYDKIFKDLSAFKTLSVDENNEKEQEKELDYFIRKNFDRHADVFKALA